LAEISRNDSYVRKISHLNTGHFPQRHKIKQIPRISYNVLFDEKVANHLGFAGVLTYCNIKAPRK
jgi:leucyl aminopeptidase (aminopeptidase T)